MFVYTSCLSVSTLHCSMLEGVRLLLYSAIVCDFSQGLRNDLKDAMDKLDQEYLTQLAMQQVHMCTKYE